MKREVDYIIVGQGLAGSALAIELLKRGKKILVFDEPDKNRASIVAAGLFNPITGRVMAKTWKADLLFPHLFEFYSKAETFLGTRFFYPMPLYRPFISIQEQNEWMGKSATPGMQPYINQILTQTRFGHHVHDEFGGLLLSQCGYVDTSSFLSSVRSYLLQLKFFNQEHFNEDELVMDEDLVHFKDHVARKIIFCNGNEAIKGRFFGWLPFRPLKGETIDVHIKQEFDCIYNRGVYVVPTSTKGQYKVGATYNTKDKEGSVTLEGKDELLTKLSELIKLPYEIGTQNWGIRPSTADRRPFLGPHPIEKNVVIFNGLGTKGVSIAPYFASQLAAWLLGEREIDPEAHINRFKFKK